MCIAETYGFNYYFYNENAWMSKEIFGYYFKKFNNEMRKANRKVLVLLDNASVHDTSLNLSNVKFLYLPPNTTSHLQPLDAGIIAFFKKQYKYV
jgi:hypothetical protein